MKVTDRSTIVPLSEIRTAPEGHPAVSTAAKGKPDRISLSDEAQRLLKEKSDRIQVLAREIQEGRYSVDLDQLAEALVRKESL